LFLPHICPIMGAAGIPNWNVVHRLEKRKLLIAINCIAGLSIFFFGYDQGMMGGVNNASDYIYTMGFGHTETIDGSANTPVIDNSLLQGGIVSIYYLGTLIGAMTGGWVGEKVGRIRTIALGALWGVIGASLQASAQNHSWMICARLINGFGTGILNAIVPVWATETAEHTSRGQFIAIEFTLNIFGVVVAYWLEYGMSFVQGGTTAIRWRFPIAFQIIPLIFLFFAVWAFPESPRWLVKVGRGEEARYILGRLRGETGADTGKAEAEYQDIQNVAALEKSNQYSTSYWSLFTGRGSGKLHTGRRVQLVIWLQIVQEWVGIAGVTVYAPTIFRISGFDTNKSQWFSGLNNIFYMFSTIICVLTLDRIGRRYTLYWGSIGQGIAMFLAGGFSRLGIDARDAGDLAKANSYGAAAASMVVIFTFVFGATWLTVPWLYPAEIFPLAVRAKGNAWGVVGWSIGNGWLTLLCPVMFSAIGEKTLYIFGIANVLSLPMVWALYPESNQRTLEEMDLLFASDSIWNWEAERTFAKLKEENPELVQAAKRAQSVIDPETGEILGPKKSISAQGGRKGSVLGSFAGRRASTADTGRKSSVTEKGDAEESPKEKD
jgi:sugar porter (SP) family MFS transporter